MDVDPPFDEESVFEPPVDDELEPPLDDEVEPPLDDEPPVVDELEPPVVDELEPPVVDEVDPPYESLLVFDVESVVDPFLLIAISLLLKKVKYYLPTIK